MGPKAFSFPEEDKAIVNKLNGLLDQLHVDQRVESVQEIGAGVFVTLFEGLCGEQLTDIVRSASTREDEVHNCQCVIDSLAGDVLHTSLTHITSAEIIDGSREAIANLLEIFSGLLEYMLNKIDSDASTDNGLYEDDQNLTADDPDRLSRDEIDSLLERELQREHRLAEVTGGIQNGGPTAAWVEDHSPEKATKKQAPKKTIEDFKAESARLALDALEAETTAELIRESEEIERRLAETRQIVADNEALERRLAESRERAQHATDRATGRGEDFATTGTAAGGDRNRPQAQTTEKEKTEDDARLTKQRESRSDIIQRLESDPRYKYMLPPTSIQTEAEDEESNETFRALQSMVEETAAMARAAVKCDANQARNLLRDMEREKRSAGTRRASPERSRRGRQYEAPTLRTAKRASPSARRGSPKASDRLSDSELTPSKAKRKVSFLVERSLTDSSPDITATSPHRRSYLESHSENTSYQDRLKKQYKNVVIDLLSDEDSPDRAKSSSRRSRYQELANRPTALYTYGETKQLVQQEKNVGKKKMGFLAKIYREDLDELVDEADYLMRQNRITAKDKEKEFQKKMLAGVKTKSQKEREGPAVLKKKTRPLQPHIMASKLKKATPSGSVLKPVKKPPLTVRDDEDLLPVLLEEFPHLHLSLHTWHELWRRGLNQIEKITRAHQEVHRKKSHAQNQLEEAEKRQEIMVNIVKKELEHEQRLKDVKDRRVNAVSTRNKLHERRIQSARSRHYYDEYQVRMRAKMLKRRTREEMMFKKLFEDGLAIQKERIHELRKYAREHRNSEARTQRDQIESMENYYRDQFHMLADNIKQEKVELTVREKAQQKVMDTMKKELRKKMEKEIRTLQEQLVRDDDDIYFRQLDSDRVIRDLKLAKYQVTV
ncbi:centrosomal protein of 95 kDa-like isoform X2 [Mya arenaria]|uniref:centrosomal protein of 95 kDa-like isoform X2 n=1 Tax=Mya arenaria TaxID=6604 RepID=UPI0022E90E76|nr:centrosomal protein of 95 kDa-like isoform X2 [Mya arenaria]